MHGPSNFSPHRSPDGLFRPSGEAVGAELRGPSADSAEDLTECIALWGNRTADSQKLSPQGSLGNIRGCSRSLSGSSVHGRPQQVGSRSSSSRAFVEQTPSAVITLSVGGKNFMSSASTLRKAPFFDNLLQQHADHSAWGASGAMVVDESTGHLFVDRSPELFAYVIDFLRCGRWLLRDHARDLDFVNALRDEAVFYGLHSDLPMVDIAEYVTVWQFRDDVSIYVDCGEHMIREDPDNQGLFRLCRYSGSLPLDQKSGTRRFKATSQGIQTVVCYFAMRGFSVTHVVEGSLITHQTSADGQGRTGPAVQYVLTRYACPSDAAFPDGLSPMRLVAE